MRMICPGRALPLLACSLLIVGCDDPRRDAGTIDMAAAKAKARAAAGDEPTGPVRGGRTPKTQSAGTGRASAPDR